MNRSAGGEDAAAAAAAPGARPAPSRVMADTRLLSEVDGAVAKHTAPAAAAAAAPAVDKRSLNYIVRSGIAGGLAGCAAKTVVGPLDRVKILFQASNPQFAKYSGSWLGVVAAMRDINRQEGLRGLFRGHSATLLRIFPYAGIKFLAYEQIRARLIPSAAHETPGRRLASGSLAGVTSVFFTYPLEVIRVRLAFETKRDSRSSLARICRQIYHEQPPRRSPAPLPASPVAAAAPVQTAAAAADALTRRAGLANFYRGFSPTLWGMLPYAGVSFLTHDTVGDLLRHPSVAPWTTVQGREARRESKEARQPPTAASSSTHPSQPLSSSDSAHASESSSSSSLRTSQSSSSPSQSLSRPGSSPSSSSSTSSSSTSSSSSSASRLRLTNTAELASGATAGLLSQTAAYPLEVIRRRMQVGGAVGDGHRLSMRETAGNIWRAAGFRGFYVGLGIGYVKVVPMVAVSFWAYERGKIMLGI